MTGLRRTPLRPKPGRQAATLRSDPEKHREWQHKSAVKAQQRQRDKPRSPIKPRNHRRANLARLEDFGTREQTQTINGMPCVCTLAPRRHPECTGGLSEPSHIVTRGAGGTAKDQVPKSSGCHRAWHSHGRATYLEAIGWTWDQMRNAAAQTWAAINGDCDATDQADY